MLLTNDIFISFPQSRNTQISVLVNGTEMKTRVYDSEWVKPATNGIGTFMIKIANAAGQYTGTFTKGQEVKFYYDNEDGTRLQFHGRIDYISDKISKEGQYLEIHGRHRAYKATEVQVCYQATNKAKSTILREIIAQYLPGFTYNNVETTTSTASPDWDYKPFWDCVIELCEGGFDCRVDNDLDFHFFAQNSKFNDLEAITDYDKLRTDDFGTDDFYEKTRVTVQGEDDAGIPIIYTAIKSDEDPDNIREISFKETNAKTLSAVQALATSKLAEYTNRPPQGNHVSFGMPTLEAGQLIWIALTREKIYGQYRIQQFTIRFGSKIGGVRYESMVEKESIKTNQLIEQRIKAENRITKVNNVNKMLYSLNYDYNSDTGTHNGTTISGGLLTLSTAALSTGTWISPVLAASEDITEVELRTFGKDIGSSLFYFSVNGGTTWELFTAANTPQPPTASGRSLRMKVTLIKDGLNANPALDSTATLYNP